MPKQVEVPGYGIVEFPDEMSDEEIGYAIKTKWPEFSQESKVSEVPYTDMFPPGVSIVEAPVAMGTGLLTHALSGLYGLVNMPTGGLKGGTEAMEEVQQLGGVPIPGTDRYVPTRWEPKAEETKLVLDTIGWPFKKAAQMAQESGSADIQRHPNAYGIAKAVLGDVAAELLPYTLESPTFRSKMAPRINTTTGVKLSPEFDFIGQETYKPGAYSKLSDKSLIEPKTSRVGKKLKVEPGQGPLITPAEQEFKLSGLQEPLIEGSLVKSQIWKAPKEQIKFKFGKTSLQVPIVKKPSFETTVYTARGTKEPIWYTSQEEAFKHGDMILEANAVINKPFQTTGAITPEVIAEAKKAKADGIISTDTGQVMSLQSYMENKWKIGQEINKPIPTGPIVELPSSPIDRSKLLSDSVVAKEYSKVAESANALEPDWSAADRWLETEGVKLYGKSQGGKAGGVSDITVDAGKKISWRALLDDERGFVDLKDFYKTLDTARYYAGRYIPRFGTVAHEDLTKLQLAKRWFSSPSYMSKVDPFPHRLTDYLIDKIGLTMNDVKEIAKAGPGANKLFRQAEGLAKSAGYILKEQNFVNTVRQDLGSVLSRGAIGSPVFSSRRGAPRAISEALIDFELETKLKEQEKISQMNDIYKGLSSDQEIVVGKLLSKYQEGQVVPPEIAAKYPKEVAAMDSVRKLIFDDLWTEVKNVRAKYLPEEKVEKMPKYLQNYFPVLFEDIDKLPVDIRAKAIRGFAIANKLDYVTAERVIKGNIPTSGFFGPLSKKRKVKVTPELEDALAWDKDVVEWYIRGAARYIGLQKFLPITKENLNKLAPNPALPVSNIYTAMREYVDQARGIPQIDIDIGPLGRRLARMEGTRQAVTKMGGSAAFGITNLTQYTLNSGIHILSSTKPGDGLYNFARGATTAFIEEGHRVMAKVKIVKPKTFEAVKSGVTADIGKGEMQVSDLHGTLRKVAEYINIFADVTQRFNATAEFNRVWPDLLKQGKANGLSGEELLNWARTKARYSVAEHQFLMGFGDRPIAFQGPIGSTVGKFKLFTIKQLEFIANLRGLEIPAFIGMNQLIGGPDALGLDYLEDELKDSKYKDSEAAQAFFKSMKVMRSASLAGQTGWDITGKIGLGFMPGLERGSDLMEELSRLAIPVSLQDAMNFAQDVREGRVASSFEQIKQAYNDKQLSFKEFSSLVNAFAKAKGDLIGMPIGLKRVAKAFIQSQTGVTEDRYGRLVEPTTIIDTLIGYPPMEVREAEIEIGKLMDDRKEASEQRKVIIAEFIDAIRRQDSHKMDLVTKRLVKFDTKYPQLGIEPIWPEALATQYGNANQLKWWRAGANVWGRARLLKEGILDEP